MVLSENPPPSDLSSSDDTSPSASEVELRARLDALERRVLQTEERLTTLFTLFFTQIEVLKSLNNTMKEYMELCHKKINELEQLLLQIQDSTQKEMYMRHVLSLKLMSIVLVLLNAQISDKSP